MSNVLGWLGELGEEIPGWSVILVTATLIMLVIGGRVLNIVDTTTAGVEGVVGGVLELPDYGYRELVRGLWASLTGVFAALTVVFGVAKMVTAFIKTGEED